MEVKRTREFSAWINALKDIQWRARILARVRRLADGNAGDHRNLTGGISELRIDVGPGYRVYYTKRGNVLVILLVGGDKASQQQDLKHARALASTLEGCSCNDTT